MPMPDERLRRPELGGFLPWLVAAVGFVLLVVDYVINAIRGVEVDESAQPNTDSMTGWWILAAVGLVLMVGGVVAGLRGRRGRQ